MASFVVLPTVSPWFGIGPAFSRLAGDAPANTHPYFLIAISPLRICYG